MQAIARPSKKRARDESSQKKLKRGGKKKQKQKQKQAAPQPQQQAQAASKPSQQPQQQAQAASEPSQPQQQPAQAASKPQPQQQTQKQTKKKVGKKSGAWADATARHPFVVTAVSDHAETPAAAYEDLRPFLEAVGDSPTIYDPYYADGGVARRLGALGFANVINRNRDFYEDLRTGNLPSHDALVTNPPYSADHVERLVAHVSEANKPFALLVPTYVLGRAYWRAAAARLDPAPFYVCPHRRYGYLPPAWARRDASAPETTAPFHTAWFCWLPRARPAFSARVDVFDAVEAVAAQYRDVTDPLKKRPNPKARKRARELQRAKAAAY